ncbi:hypothetical protein DFJ58DRAFT_850668 [Suillus subalutaceus]|uniref:uncharacterized protein n=1 Tax=Suillus subalutaceus TaxID=48586 RepID=UPI001B873E46|nr:uncharacterized protein DFJ58DRAFT_850668 [Suillus subalutaceus]KAG1813483.1 hypothetical protein DFJ58DRAFT_850668 [Suillus subalutaceus]
MGMMQHHSPRSYCPAQPLYGSMQRVASLKLCLTGAPLFPTTPESRATPASGKQLTTFLPLLMFTPTRLTPSSEAVIMKTATPEAELVPRSPSPICALLEALTPPPPSPPQPAKFKYLFQPMEAFLPVATDNMMSLEAQGSLDMAEDRGFGDAESWPADWACISPLPLRVERWSQGEVASPGKNKAAEAAANPVKHSKSSAVSRHLAKIGQ